MTQLGTTQRPPCRAISHTTYTGITVSVQMVRGSVALVNRNGVKYSRYHG